MKRQEHEAEVRSKIIKQARLLFLEQGYNQTTIRQIKAAADVKTGTLYHFYSDKEDIFFNIVREAFSRTTIRTQKLVSSGNKTVELACEIAWHMYVMANHMPSAELYLISYNSPRIASKLIEAQSLRSQEVFKEKAPHLSAQEHTFRAMMTKGFLQSVAQRAVLGELTDVQDYIEVGIKLSLNFFGLDDEEINYVLKELEGIKVESHVQEILAY